jgi:hypothetical protein
VPRESDKWPDEPDEPDPESRWGNPEEDLVSIPSVEGPAATDSGEAGAGVEIDSEVARLFWVSVVYANVALGGVAIGLMLVVFRGQWTVGGGAVAIGCFALYRTYDLYRTYQAEVVEECDDPDSVTDEPTDATADGTTESTEAAVDSSTDTTHE